MDLQLKDEQMKLPLNRKKLLNFSLIITSCFVISCTSDDETEHLYLDIPDEIFETILIKQGIDSDGKINQKILKADAKAVSVLDLNDLSNGEITSLAGVEGFVNLKKLYVTKHSIEHIDLSANILLDTLYLSGNHISDIDLSNNINLVLIDIQSNNLSSISGLSKLEKLIDLDLSWNYFEEFSIHNKSLEVLHFSHNDLKSLNTTGAVNLKNVYMPSNKLEAVDFSTNTSLETILVSNNKLQQISIEHNIELTHLYISSNALTNIDVSNNKNLVDLRVDRNPVLTCVKIKSGQYIPTVFLSDYQELNSICD
jgi:hypothetical protein